MCKQVNELEQVPMADGSVQAEGWVTGASILIILAVECHEPWLSGFGGALCFQKLPLVPV